MGVGLRAPTNLFGKPTDELISNIDKALSQWSADELEGFPLTKIAFGHFPLSFSASTWSGRNLRDLFLNHSLDAYLCGHLHTTYGLNLKRHHALHPSYSSSKYYQHDVHSGIESTADPNCSAKANNIKEFWEWEMGDWRSARSVRILAIDAGHVSFTDIDYRHGSHNIIIVPTFPLDSRFMQRLSSAHQFICESEKADYLKTVRALIFSKNEIASVMVLIYDSLSGSHELVLEGEMTILENKGSRGNMFVLPWNWRAFIDESPDRYLLQIKAVDITGQTYTSKLRPFSINGLIGKAHWTWKEHLVMGCQWDELYQPILWSMFLILFSLVIFPQALRMCFEKYFVYKYQKLKVCGCSLMNCFIGNLTWIGVELCRMGLLWSGILLYLLFLAFFPWFSGHAIAAESGTQFMSHRGWNSVNLTGSFKGLYIGVPDVMIIVIPHLCFVVLPAILALAAMAAERTVFRAHYLSLAGKKEDDFIETRGWAMNCIWNGRWIRKLLLLVCVWVLWKHIKQCRYVVKAYDINPFLNAPIYCFWIPALLAFGIFKTSAV